MQDRVNALLRCKRRDVDRSPACITDRPGAGVLGIPDGQLAFKVAESADGDQIEPLDCCSAPQLHEGRGDVHMHAAAEPLQLDKVRACPAGQFKLILDFGSRVAAISATWSSTRVRVITSCASAIVYRP